MKKPYVTHEFRKYLVKLAHSRRFAKQHGLTSWSIHERNLKLLLKVKQYILSETAHRGKRVRYRGRVTVDRMLGGYILTISEPRSTKIAT